MTTETKNVVFSNIDGTVNYYPKTLAKNVFITEFFQTVW